MIQRRGAELLLSASVGHCIVANLFDEIETNKIIIGMNQLDIINGGHQINRGSKYLIDNNHNDKSNLYNFSFSGLKTAVRRLIEKVNQEPFHHLTIPAKISLENKKDISASFQFTVAEIIANRLENVLNKAETKALVENNQLQKDTSICKKKKNENPLENSSENGPWHTNHYQSCN